MHGAVGDVLQRRGSNGLQVPIIQSGDKQQQDLLRLVYQERRAAVLHGNLNARSLTSPGQQAQWESVRPKLLRSLWRTAGVFAVYVVLAVLLLIPIEEWNVLDCAYFAVVTFTTVGYGDLAPTSAHGKVIAMVLSVMGLVTVTASLNDLTNIVGKERRRRRLDHFEWRWNKRGSGAGEQPMAYAESTLVHASADGVLAASRRLAPSMVPVWADERCEQLCQSLQWTFEAMQPFLVAITAGTCLGFFAEGWGLLDSVYFSLISILTVGFGDFAPTTRLGRTLCTLFLPMTCAAALRSISIFGGALVELIAREGTALDADGGLDEQIARLGTQLSRSTGAREHGLVSEADFICSTLEELGLVEDDILGRIREQFYRLDKRGLGFLSMEQYEQLLSVRRGGARRRWQHAVGLVLKEQRVLKALKVAMPVVQKLRRENSSRVLGHAGEVRISVAGLARSSPRWRDTISGSADASPLASADVPNPRARAGSLDGRCVNLMF